MLLWENKKMFKITLGIIIGILICEDLWHDTTMTPIMEQHPDAVISIQASPFEKNKFQIIYF